MHGGCTAVMGSSMHANSRFGGFIEDPFFCHQDSQQIQYVDQQMIGQMMFSPTSCGIIQTSAAGNCKEAENNFIAKCEVNAAPHILGGRVGEVDAYNRAAGELDAYHRSRELDSFQGTGELDSVVRGVTRSSWVRRNEIGLGDGRIENKINVASGSFTTPSLPMPTNLLSTSVASCRASPALSRSPDNKIPEPRSVLDLAISPRISARSTVSSGYDFATSSLESNSHDEFLTDFYRRDDSSAQLLSLAEEEDSSQWEPPMNSTNDWLQQTSQLWMDSLMDDLGSAPALSSLPGLEDRDEARTDTPSSTPSEFCYKSPSTDREQSEDEGIFADDSQTLQRGSVKGISKREVGQQLVNLLLACAEAVSTKSLSLVNPLFAQLGELASPEGTSMQRMAAYFTEGLASRCSRLWPQIYQPLPYNLDLSDEDSLSAFHILNHVCPYIKFAHFTANDIILEAFKGCDRVHVIDFDIKQGLQWPALFQSLAARPEGPPSHIRVTGIGEYKEDVQDTGDRLAEFAEALDLPFEFHAVIDKLEDVRLWMLHVKEKEAVAVNCIFQLHRTLHDETKGIMDMLRLVMSTKPKVVAVVEQEASHNGQFFEGRYPRFLESLQYYAAIFDSLDANMSATSSQRIKVEQFFARDIRNIMACEGPERVERHEGIETWRAHLDSEGFQSVPLSKRAKTQARLLLEMFSCKSYTLKVEDDALTLGWQSRPLFTATGWVPKYLPL